MMANLLNTAAGLVLAYATVLHPTWIEQRCFPLFGFAAAILVLAIGARRRDPDRWYSMVNIVLAVALGLRALLPRATRSCLAFWVGRAVPIVALWAALYGSNVRAGKAHHARTCIACHGPGGFRWRRSIPICVARKIKPW